MANTEQYLTIQATIASTTEIKTSIAPVTEIKVNILDAGPQGAEGKGLEYNWDGTKLGIRKIGEHEYTYRELAPEIIENKYYLHDQMPASKEWMITHNMNKYPSVTIVDSGNTVVVGEIKYLNANQLILYFTAEFSGKAYLN